MAAFVAAAGTTEPEPFDFGFGLAPATGTIAFDWGASLEREGACIEATAVAKANAAKYGATPFPLVDGGCVHSSIGADATGIVVAYCDAAVLRFIELHRPVTIANQLIGDFTAPPSEFVQSPQLLPTLTAMTHAMTELTAFATDEAAITRTQQWLETISNLFRSKRNELEPLRFRVRFNSAVREWLFAADTATATATVTATVAATAAAMAKGDDADGDPGIAKWAENNFLASNIPRVAQQLLPFRPASTAARQALSDRLSLVAFDSHPLDFEDRRRAYSDLNFAIDFDRFARGEGAGQRSRLRLFIKCAVVDRMRADGLSTYSLLQVTADRGATDLGVSLPIVFSAGFVVDTGTDTGSRSECVEWVFDNERMQALIAGKIEAGASFAAVGSAQPPPPPPPPPPLRTDSVLSSVTPHEWASIFILMLLCMPSHSTHFRRIFDKLLKQLNSEQAFAKAPTEPAGESVRVPNGTAVAAGGAATNSNAPMPDIAALSFQF